MQRQPLVASQRDRIAAGLPFVESLARRVASSMPHSIELGDLVQDGMLGVVDAARRFGEGRGIEPAREQLRRELGAEPSLADLAARVGSDEVRLGRTIVRINTIESTSPLANGDPIHGATLPPGMKPS